MDMSATAASSGSWVTSTSVRAARAIDAEQQVDDLAAGRAVEISGRLVGQQQRRVVGERPRDRHALLLAARELGRIVMAAFGQADLVEQRRRARAALRHAGDLHRHEDVLERGQRRQQVEELEDEADAQAAQPRERVFVERGDVDAVDRDLPVDGASSPAISPSSVDLPLPEAPVIATTCPSGTTRSIGWRMVSVPLPLGTDLRDAAKLDHEAES